MNELIINAVYAVELCSGEVRYWQYLGPDSRRLIWWLDTETQHEFNEASVMYAWSINGLHSSRLCAPSQCGPVSGNPVVQVARSNCFSAARACQPCSVDEIQK